MRHLSGRVSALAAGFSLLAASSMAAIGRDLNQRMDPIQKKPPATARVQTAHAAPELSPAAASELTVIPAPLAATANPVMGATPASLAFFYTHGGPSPSPQSVSLSSSGDPLAFTLAVSTSSGGSWLSATPASGTAPGALVVSVNPAGLPNGVHSGSIRVTSAATNSPVVIPVTLGLLVPLTVAPASLSFSYQAGSAQLPPGQVLNIGSGGFTVPFSVTFSGGNWLSASPLNGTTPSSVTVSVNPANLAPGTYVANLVVSAGPTADGPRTVPVTLTVSAPIPPSLSPSAMTFEIQAGTATPGPRTLSITSATPISFTAAAATLSGGNWLSVTPASGITPADLAVTVNPASVPAGTHSGVITITAANNTVQTLNVTLTVSAPLALSQTSLSFNHTQGTSNPPAQSLGVSSSGFPMNFSVSATSSGPAQWLAATPVSGTTPSSVSVNVNAGGLAPGTYTGTVMVASAAASNSPRTANVTLTVVPAPAIATTPSSLLFEYEIGRAAPAPQALNISSGGTPANFAVTANGGNWLSVSTSQGTTPATVSVSVNPNQLAAGVYAGSIVISSAAAGTRTVPVQLTVTTPVRVTPGALTFEGVAGQVLTAQPIAIASGAATVPFSLLPSSSQNWLSVNQASGITPTMVQVSANSAGLSPGTYVGFLRLSLGGESPQTLDVPVTLVLRAAIGVNPDSLTFEGSPGGLTRSQTITVSAGAFPMPLSASAVTSDGRGWLSVSPAGTVAPATLTVTANPAGLPVGGYTGFIQVASQNAGPGPVTIPVLFTISAPAPLTVSASALTFSQVAGAPPPAAQTIVVSPAPSDLLATVSMQGGGNWLSASIHAGGTVSVSVSGGVLAPGVYEGGVTIRQESGAGNSISVPVRFTVTTPLSASPAGASFVHVPGLFPPASQSLTISSGGRPVAFQATSSGEPWLQVNSTGGTTPANLTISVNPSTLPPGTYNGTVFIASSLGSNSPLALPVTLTVALAGELQFSVSAFDFSQTDTITFGVTSSTQFGLPFTIDVEPAAAGARRTAADTSWLTVSPSSAITPATITASVNRTNLAPGNYTATVRFRALQQEYAIPAFFTVPPPAPSLQVSPDPIQLEGASGVLESSFHVRNISGFGSQPFTVDVVEGAWLSVSSRSGFTQRGEASWITVRASLDGLLPGPHRGLIRVRTGSEIHDLPVSMFVRGGPTFGLAFRGVQFEVRKGQGTSRTQEIPILNNGDGRLDWTAVVTRGANWLSISPQSGSVIRGQPNKITLRTNSRSLEIGVYYASIEITDSSAPNSPQLVTVVLNVIDPASPPNPMPAPEGLVFVAVAGQSAPPSREIEVHTSGLAPIPFGAATSTRDGGSWLRVQPMSGNTSSDDAAKVLVSVDHSLLRPGVYNGEVNFSMAPRVVRAVNVTLIVTTVEPLSTVAPNSTRRQTAGCTPSRLTTTHTGLVNSFSSAAGWPVPLTVRVLDDCGEVVPRARVVLNFSNGDPPIGMNVIDERTATFSATWTPAKAQPQTTITARASFGPLVGTSEITGSVDSNAVPILAPGGTLHNLNPRVGGPLAPGNVVAIFGQNLAAAAVSPSLPLPREVNGTVVVIGGIDAPLYFVSPAQINAQIPVELEPNRQYPVLIIANGMLTTPDSVTLAPAEPGMAAFANGAVIAQHTADFSLVTPENPARPGEALIVYLAGMGRTDTSVGTGEQAPGVEPLARTRIPVSVTLGGSPVQVLYSGLTPGGIGLYQINFVVPPNAPDGELPLAVLQNGVTSNVSLVPVRRP